MQGGSPLSLQLTFEGCYSSSCRCCIQRKPANVCTNLHSQGPRDCAAGGAIACGIGCC